MARLLMTAWITGIALQTAGLPLTARSEDFRVETTIKIDKKTQIEFLTIFRGTVVYDFRVDGGEVSIFDMARKQVILADQERQQKTLIQFSELRSFSQTLLERAIARGEKGFFDPNIDVRFVEDADLPFKVATDVLGYAANGIEPPQQDFAARYYHFVDAAAMLSGMKPGGIPPFVRMRLNQSLYEKGMVPEKVERTILHRYRLRNQRETVVAEHRFNWITSQSDKKRIDEVNSWLAKCEPVSLEKYLDINPLVASPPTKPATQRR